MPKTKKDTEKVNPADAALAAFMKKNEKDHYNKAVKVDINYQVSFGSLKIDRVLDGGLGAGTHRFMGPYESGKTSASLEVMRNFLKMEKTRGLYIQAEGRLSQKMIRRSGLPFVDRLEDWKEGTIFIFRCNVYDTVINFVENLTKNNPELYRYCMVLDSMDALNLKEDLEKDTTDSNHKVAGAAKLSKMFLRRNSLPFHMEGHLAILISQVSE